MDTIVTVIVALIHAAGGVLASRSGRRRETVRPRAKTNARKGPFMTSADVALYFRVKEWHMRMLWETGKLPEPPRFAGCRVLTEADLPGIEAALREAGYLK